MTALQIQEEKELSSVSQKVEFINMLYLGKEELIRNKLNSLFFLIIFVISWLHLTTQKNSDKS